MDKIKDLDNLIITEDDNYWYFKKDSLDVEYRQLSSKRELPTMRQFMDKMERVGFEYRWTHANGEEHYFGKQGERSGE